MVLLFLEFAISIVQVWSKDSNMKALKNAFTKSSLKYDETIQQVLSLISKPSYKTTLSIWLVLKINRVQQF